MMVPAVPPAPSLSLTVLVVFLAALAPVRVVLILVIPLLMVLGDYSGVIGPVLNLGEARVGLGDLALILTAGRCAWHFARGAARLPADGSLGAVAGYSLVMVVATAAAGLLYGSATALASLPPLARFLGQATVPFLLALSLPEERERRSAARLTLLIGHLMAGSVLWNMVFAGRGLRFGEVHLDGPGRFFGPVGDQVGFLLALFAAWALATRRWITLVVFSVAVVGTGTRGALVVLVVALAGTALALQRHTPAWSLRLAALGVVAAGLVAATWAADLGGVRTRVATTGGDTSTSQRLLTWRVALGVFGDNPVTGAGFGGLPRRAAAKGAETVFARELFQHSSFLATAANQLLQSAVDAGVLGVLALVWLVVASSRSLRAAALASPAPALFLAGGAWVAGLALGNQTASWLLPNSLITYVLMLLLGQAAAARGSLAAGGRVATNHATVSRSFGTAEVTA